MFEGEVPVSYYQIDDDGRRFSRDFSLTNMARPIRHTITRGCIDIDMKNAHPCILLWLCKHHGIQCDLIEMYVNQRDKMIGELKEGRGLSRDGAKKMLLRAINRDDGLFQQTEDDPDWLYDYHQQCKKITEALSKFYPQYLAQADKSKKRKDQSAWNMKGSALNRLLCHHENELLSMVEKTVVKHNGKVCNLAYDGCMIEDTFSPDEIVELFKDIETEVQITYPNMVFKMDVKEMNEGFLVPDNFITKKERKVIADKEKERRRVNRLIDKEVGEEDETEDYLEWKYVFEQKHCKIKEPTAILYKTSLDQYEFLSPMDLKQRYSHMGIQFVRFIDRWWYDPEMRVYTRADIFSPSEECPKDVFNLWKPYPFEGREVDMTTETMEMAYLVLHHLFIVCGNEEQVHEYLLDWIAQTFQYPHVKTTMPTFASEEGAGKNTVAILLEKLMAKRSVLVTSKADEVFGKFNGSLAHCMVVVLNELSAVELRQYDGVIKDLITDSSVSIQGKGKENYPLRSMHRFINFTNKDYNPIQTSDGDRRKLIVRCSDEKIGDGVYFTRLYTCLENEDVLTWLFQFFMNRNIQEFNSTKGRNIPKTEYQMEIAHSNSDVVSDWLEYVIEEYHENRQETELRWSAQDQLSSFREYCSNHGVKLDIDSRKLGCRLSLLVKKRGILGISNKHSKFGERRHFDFSIIIPSISK